jgi:hypothetical protein
MRSSMSFVDRRLTHGLSLLEIRMNCLVFYLRLNIRANQIQYYDSNDVRQQYAKVFYPS